MPFPSKPFSEWQKEDLDALLADPPAVESARVDFKAECKLLSGDPDEKEKARRAVLVDVASMANGSGGALLIGVRQSGDPTGPPAAARIEGIGDPERVKQAISGLVNTHLDVRPAALRQHVVTWDGSVSVLIVEVPENLYSLTMVTYTGLNQFWIRRGTDNQPMTTDEIEYRFGRFAKVRADASEELQRLHRRALAGDFTPLAWFGAVPLARARDHVPVIVRDIQDMLANSSYFSACGRRADRGTLTPLRYSGDLRPSLAGIGRNPNDGGFLAVLEIGRDGSFVFACKMRLSSEDPLGNTPAGGESPGRVQLWEIYEPILSGLHAFADIQARFGMGRAALAQAGVHGVQDTVVVRGGDGLDDLVSPRLFQVSEVPLDALTLDEHWEPQQVFQVWATQLANALGEEEPLALAPWI